MGLRFGANVGWYLTAILAVALMLRLGAGFWWQARLAEGQKFGFGDSEGYWELARTIAQGKPYEYAGALIFRTPGYPALLAPLFVLRDEPPVIWGRAVSAVLGTVAVGGVAALAWLLFSQRTAIVAAALAAVYPEAIALGTFILSEAPFTPLMLIQLIFWTLAWQAGGRNATEGVPYRLVGWSLAAGLAAGLATLMRPSWILFVPFAGGIGFVAAVAGWSAGTGSLNATEGVPYRTAALRHLLIMTVMVVGLYLTMTPWWIRNYRVAGRFVPTSLQVGASLYDGLSPTATGASDMQFVPGFIAEQRAADAQPAANTRGLFEDRLDRRMRDAALSWARHHPGQVIRLAAVKFVRMWNFVPNAGEFQSPMLRLVLVATYTPVVGLALVGAWRYAKRAWPYVLCVLPAAYFTCLHVIFVSSIRYRQPAMLALIVLSAAVLTQWTERRRD